MLILLPMVSGCYLPMTGTIIDAETKAPIEGAVVLVEWTKTKGIGFTYTESYKVAETLSDKEGKFKLPGCVCIATEDPDITIYKKGYVAWNNQYIYPNYAKRTNVVWGANNYELVMFKPTESHDKHITFIHSLIHQGLGEKKVMPDSLSWEESEAFRERTHR
jgi:hypothetical protein